ncbi:hypothetical protein BDC45DRAFT_536826 [Circinella umbellata]|nr:hypothetical protein BDC45DRAFT_536826 [Circinella umbellata]
MAHEYSITPTDDIDPSLHNSFLTLLLLYWDYVYHSGTASICSMECISIIRSISQYNVELFSKIRAFYFRTNMIKSPALILIPDYIYLLKGKHFANEKDSRVTFLHHRKTEPFATCVYGVGQFKFENAKSELFSVDRPDYLTDTNTEITIYKHIHMDILIFAKVCRIRVYSGAKFE